jgi:hypothetical protein
MIAKLRILFILTLMAVMIVGTNAVSANERVPADADSESWGTLVESKVIENGDLVEVIEIFEGERFEIAPGLDEVGITATCSRLTVRRSFLSGATLYARYIQQLSRCWSGGKLTKIYDANVYAEVNHVCTKFNGWKTLARSGGVGQTSYRWKTQGTFTFNCAGYYVGNKYPWHDVTYRGDGSYTASQGG